MNTVIQKLRCACTTFKIKVFWSVKLYRLHG